MAAETLIRKDGMTATIEWKGGVATDERNNRATLAWFKTKEKAIDALLGLSNCSDCSDCSGCSDCFDCSRCYGCSDCSNCSDCSRCSNCSDCSRCYGCSDCSDCSDCFDCSRCSRCSDCSGCSDCYSCYGCSDCYSCYGCSDCYSCSDCSRCYGCSDCSRCSDCSGCSDKRGESSEGFGAIPQIENIHKTIYEAVSKEGALNMGDWHSCETTHCRAGWAVHLAGASGYELERRTSPLFAAMMIYKESGYPISPCRFFDSNDVALEDMKKLAEVIA